MLKAHQAQTATAAAACSKMHLGGTTNCCAVTDFDTTSSGCGGALATGAQHVSGYNMPDSKAPTGSAPAGAAPQDVLPDVDIFMFTATPLSALAPAPAAAAAPATAAAGEPAGTLGAGRELQLPWLWLLGSCCLQWSQQLAQLPPNCNEKAALAVASAGTAAAVAAIDAVAGERQQDKVHCWGVLAAPPEDRRNILGVMTQQLVQGVEPGLSVFQM